MNQDHEIPRELEQYDDRADVTAEPPIGSSPNVVNVCLNCVRKELNTPRTNSTDDSILRAVGNSTLLGREIADRLGLKFNSNFRARLSRLELAGLLENVPRLGKSKIKGYRIPKKI